MNKGAGITCLLLFFLLSGTASAGEPGYAETLRKKLGAGISNIFTGWVEVPKNMINTSNQSGNVLFGIVGGGGKGLVHMLGRTLSGVVDFVTFPIPTKPIPRPPFVWQNFYMDTQYGPYFSDVREDPYSVGKNSPQGQVPQGSTRPSQPVDRSSGGGY